MSIIDGIHAHLAKRRVQRAQAELARMVMIQRGHMAGFRKHRAAALKHTRGTR